MVRGRSWELPGGNQLRKRRSARGSGLKSGAGAENFAPKWAPTARMRTKAGASDRLATLNVGNLATIGAGSADFLPGACLECVRCVPGGVPQGDFSRMLGVVCGLPVVGFGHCSVRSAPILAAGPMF